MKEQIGENQQDIESTEPEKKPKIEADDNFEIIPDEVLDAIPVEDRSRIKSIISQTMISSVMKRNNPISEKVTTEHITKLIENSNVQDERDRKERKSEKNYQIIFLLIGLVFIGFLIVFLKDDKELLYKVIIAIISFVGGFGIGKTSKKQKNNEE